MTPEEKKIVEALAYTMNDLHSWYQQSIDETVPPIWTDGHIEELFNDFYLVPKEREEFKEKEDN